MLRVAGFVFGWVGFGDAIVCVGFVIWVYLVILLVLRVVWCILGVVLCFAFVGLNCDSGLSLDFGVFTCLSFLLVVLAFARWVWCGFGVVGCWCIVILGLCCFAFAMGWWL